MQKTKNHIADWNARAAALWFAVLAAYILLRAYFFQLTYDEVSSIVGHVPFGVPTILAAANPIACANNHIINTLWLKFCLFAFGNNELLLRLPNVLSFGVAYYFAWRLAQLLHQKNKAVPYIVYLILFFANPFLIEFFALARGYGILSGLVLASIYYLTKFIYARDKSDFYHSFGMAVAACFGNFIALYYLVALVLLFLGLMISDYYKNETKNEVRQQFTRLIAVIGIAFGLLFVPLRNLIASGDGAGGTRGFFIDTIGSLSSSFLHDNPFLINKSFFGYSFQWYLSVFFIFIFAIIALLLAYKTRKEGMEIVRAPVFAAIFLLVTVAIISIFLFHSFHIYYLATRTGIILMLLFSWSVVAAMHCLSSNWRYKNHFLVGICLPLLVHFALVANVSRSQEWGCDGDAKNIIKVLNEKYQKTNRQTPIKVFSVADGGIALRYYIDTKCAETLKWQGNEPDFIYVDADKTLAEQAQFDIAYRLPHGVLMSRKPQ